MADLSEERLAAARRDGVEEATTDVASLPSDRFDIVIDATGAPAMLSQAIRLARPGGRVLMFGVAPQGKTAPSSRSRSSARDFRYSPPTRRAGTACRRWRSSARGRSGWMTLCRTAWPWTGLEAGIRKIEDRSANAMKVMVSPTGTRLPEDAGPQRAFLNLTGTYAGSFFSMNLMSNRANRCRPFSRGICGSPSPRSGAPRSG